ncbi:MAG TPA: class I SAM-dependent methyltransferase [Steroidobacteraceae bacterium]|nr:class I SAM-dependent methyltransferase [Steroidobacteraceae bacterium]
MEEVRIGGSYREVFHRAVLPYLARDSKVLELGPGSGSWTRAILSHVPRGEVHTIGFQDVRRWIGPVPGSGRLVCHQVSDNSFTVVPDDTFDFFWSFGVLCHNNLEHIREIFRNALPKMKPGAHAAHEIGDWRKLDQLGWRWRWGVPARFKSMPDDAIWWPRNSAEDTCRVAEEEGWQVVERDLGLLRRDSLCVFRRPSQ